MNPIRNKTENIAKETLEREGYIVRKPRWPDLIAIKIGTNEVLLVEVKDLHDRCTDRIAEQVITMCELAQSDTIDGEVWWKQPFGKFRRSKIPIDRKGTKVV